MSVLRCPCGAFVVDEVVHLSDSESGLFAVTERPVADFVHECRCGRDIAVTSTQAVVQHPGQLVLVDSRACSPVKAQRSGSTLDAPTDKEVA